MMIKTKTTNKLQTNIQYYAFICFLFSFKYLNIKIQSHVFLKKYLISYLFSKKRIYGYTIKVSVIVGDFLEAIFERKLNEIEYENLFLAGAISPLFDEFCDNNNHDEIQLTKIIEDRYDNENNPKVDLFLSLLRVLRSRKENNELFETSIRQIFNSQLLSKIQKNTTDRDVIRDITFQKGGKSFLFYASCTESISSEIQKKVIYNFGSFVQLLDDVFDISQDITEGNNTLATININHLNELNNELEFKYDNNAAEINELKISRNNKNRLLRIYLLLLIPTQAYLTTLIDASKTDEIIDENNNLQKKYRWKSWDISNTIQFIKYLISN